VTSTASRDRARLKDTSSKVIAEHQPLKNPALKGTADAGPARPTVSLTCVPAPFPDRAESLSLSWSPLRELRTFSLP
jgi:hypothetical protein